MFIYIPVILNELFEPYCATVLENVSEFISSPDENIRQITFRVSFLGVIEGYENSYFELWKE